MSVALVTGAAGLVGSTVVRRFLRAGWLVVGIDNDMRAKYFGASASTLPVARSLAGLAGYEHHEIDIRDIDAVERVIRRIRAKLELVVHTAAQPSHDWAAQQPLTDFDVNARATLGLLDATRRHAQAATFIFTSTNKVYGDTPNRLPFVEYPTRFDLPTDHEWFGGIPTTMSIDASTHSLFGVSKVAADLLVQEYSRYFGLNTMVFRGGCLTGSSHAGAELHGFLSYLMRCAVTGHQYTVNGYGGKQVRDNIHSEDLSSAFELAASDPRTGAVYNIGGGRENSCSVTEAIALCEEISGRRMNLVHSEHARIGDHIWWVSDLSSFERDYPSWKLEYSLRDILEDIHQANVALWQTESV